MAKRAITVNHKEYVMPKLDDIDAYLNYLEIRDSIMGTEKKNGLYTAEQFRQMMECICELYGNQFTVDELKDKETGIGVSGIVIEFAAIEMGMGEEVNATMEKIQKNFPNGK